MPFDPVYPESRTLEVELNGPGGGWTAITDVDESSGVVIKRGLAGSSQRDRVSTTGTMSFVLNNSENNSGGLLGYYSPRNANCRSGWKLGIAVRYSVTYVGIPEKEFVGTISSILPIPGRYGERKVQVQCVDWMEEAAKAKIRGLQVMIDARSNEVFERILVSGVERQPPGYAIQIGGDQYPYALDNAFEGDVTAMSEFQRLAQSELGRIYTRRDGYIVFESRHKRPNLQVSQLVLTDEDTDDVEQNRDRSSIVNHSEVTAHPRRVDTAATSILFVLANIPSIPRNTPLNVNGLFRDPDARATRVGGMEMVQPVATTDYTFNSLADGTGTNLTNQLTVTAEYSANGADITITNNGPEDGFLTKLQCRGKGIYDYETVIARSDSQASKDEYGVNDFSLDMPYQHDLNTAQDAADFIVQQSKDILTQVSGVAFFANREDRLMKAALRLDVSDRIELTETVIGSAPFIPVGEDVQEISATKFFINGIELHIGENGIIRCVWTLEPADPFNYWILERDGFTELGETTRLAYGSFVAGWVLDSSVLGTETRVNQ